MNKAKSILFKLLEKALLFFSKIGVNKRTPGAFKVYNFFYKIFWPYKNIIDIQGSKMYVNVSDNSFRMRQTFESYARNKIHEEATTSLFKKIVKPGNVVLDLGANIGYFTLLSAKLVGENGKVYSFEPEPKNYSYLLKNIKLNNYKNVIALQKAVSDKTSRTKLYICDYDTGHHTINQQAGIRAYGRGRSFSEHSIGIETISLDEFFKNKEEAIDVIKIDIEGAEALALSGMDRILRKNQKIKMFMEFFPLLIKKMGSSPEEFIVKLLNDYSFSISVIPDDYDAFEGKEPLKITNVDELLALCENETDHLNLFLSKAKKYDNHS